MLTFDHLVFRITSFFYTAQVGVNSNITYTLDAASQQVAYIIAQCGKKDIKSVERKLRQRRNRETLLWGRVKC
jgi:hypothetical protein